MAKVTNPLLSLDARGSIADAITYQGVKGLRVATLFHRPTDPQTASQLTQRSRLTAAEAYWHTYCAPAAYREPWERLATVLRKPGREYDLAIKQMMIAQAHFPTPTFHTALGNTILGRPYPTKRRLIGTGYPNEPDYITFYAGPDPYHMTLAGVLKYGYTYDIGPRVGENGQTVYVALTCAGSFRGGIFKFVVQDTAPNKCPNPRFADTTAWTLEPGWFISGERLCYQGPQAAIRSAWCTPTILTATSYKALVQPTILASSGTTSGWLNGSKLHDYNHLGSHYGAKLVTLPPQTWEFRAAITANPWRFEFQEVQIYQ